MFICFSIIYQIHSPQVHMRFLFFLDTFHRNGILYIIENPINFYSILTFVR